MSVLGIHREDFGGNEFKIYDNLEDKNSLLVLPMPLEGLSLSKDDAMGYLENFFGSSAKEAYLKVSENGSTIIVDKGILEAISHSPSLEDLYF